MLLTPVMHVSVDCLGFEFCGYSIRQMCVRDCSKNWPKTPKNPRKAQQSAKALLQHC
jgi:hypothetical protein